MNQGAVHLGGPRKDRRGALDIVDELTRRQLIEAGFGLVAAGFLAGCAREVSSGAAGQGWTFTDDRGVTVSLPNRPTRIVAFETPGAALAHLGIRPLAIFGTATVADAPGFEEISRDGIESVGSVYGEVNLERVAALGTELVVTAYDPRQGELVYGFTELAAQRQLEQIAPVLAIDGTKDVDVVMGRFEELAQSLGADLASPAIAKPRAEFEAAYAELEQALAAKPGLTAVALEYFGPSTIYFVVVEQNPGLRLFRRAGLDFAPVAGLAPPGPGEEFDYGIFADEVSLELVDKYPADLMIHSTRSAMDDLAGVPTWSRLPAVQADQLVAWRAYEGWSYANYTTQMRDLLAAVRTADTTLVA